MTIEDFLKLLSQTDNWYIADGDMAFVDQVDLCKMAKNLLARGETEEVMLNWADY
jgi:hypothetical protein